MSFQTSKSGDDLTSVKEYVELGMVPVLYGDAVLDSEQTFAILSGDSE